mmetsp:Transcript_2178/g.2255  ORF Transcript_2178/g.2255 Transcript_2178/m.2255 type:complete len:94 (-) Transcript_2178:64-345(-)
MLLMMLLSYRSFGRSGRGILKKRRTVRQSNLLTRTKDINLQYNDLSVLILPNSGNYELMLDIVRGERCSSLYGENWHMKIICRVGKAHIFEEF